MWCNQIFSLMSIKPDASYKIENIIVADDYTVANQIAKAEYGINAIAIETTRFPLCIGDYYQNGNFYNQETGERVLPVPTEEEQIKELKSLIEELILLQSDILYELDSTEEVANEE